MYINRSDEDDPSGSKYTRMEEESIQDKERFARALTQGECNLLAITHVIVPPHPSISLPLLVERAALNAANDKPRPQKAVNAARQLEKFTGKSCVDFTETSRAGKALLTADVNFVIVGRKEKGHSVSAVARTSLYSLGRGLRLGIAGVLVGARRRAMSWPWLQAASPSFPPPPFTWRLRQPLERSADRGNGSGHDTAACAASLCRFFFLLLAGGTTTTYSFLSVSLCMSTPTRASPSAACCQP
uniref:Uncharacterized protein n=1 Tax=Timema genevievae TaxID=629358 RepID=A0A7R9PKF3_TIMGE|nr:unnamed protein product [Timema genevievae]